MVVPKITLLQLAKHLESGKLAHVEFNFICYNDGTNYREDAIPGCGYAGCALGEMPALDSRWTFTAMSCVKYGRYMGLDAAAVYFNISLEQSHKLFAPSGWVLAPWNKRQVSGKTFEEAIDYADALTARQVAASIRRYLKWKKENK